MSIVVVALIVFLLNVPFGYWRANVKRFSLQWFVSVHLPVPFIILVRVISGLGFELISFPFLIAAFFLGQFLGGVIHNWLGTNSNLNVSSCLVVDLYRASGITDRRS